MSQRFPELFKARRDVNSSGSRLRIAVALAETRVTESIVSEIWRGIKLEATECSHG